MGTPDAPPPEDTKAIVELSEQLVADSRALLAEVDERLEVIDLRDDGDGHDVATDPSGRRIASSPPG